MALHRELQKSAKAYTPTTNLPGAANKGKAIRHLSVEKYPETKDLLRWFDELGTFEFPTQFDYPELAVPRALPFTWTWRMNRVRNLRNVIL